MFLMCSLVFGLSSFNSLLLIKSGPVEFEFFVFVKAVSISFSVMLLLYFFGL